MKIMSYLTGTAIALAVSVGSASAAEQFSVLEGITAVPLHAGDMELIRGAAGIGTNPLKAQGVGGGLTKFITPAADQIFFDRSLETAFKPAFGEFIVGTRSANGVLHEVLPKGLGF